MQEWWVIFASFISFMQTLNDTFWGSESSRVENCHHKWRTLPSTLTLAVDDKQSQMQTKVSKRNVSFNGKMLKVMHSWKGQKKTNPTTVRLHFKQGFHMLMCCTAIYAHRIPVVPLARMKSRKCLGLAERPEMIGGDVREIKVVLVLKQDFFFLIYYFF